MADKMTIENLQCQISLWITKEAELIAGKDAIEGERDCRIEGRKDAFCEVHDYIRNNRAALEAGMRGVLRWKKASLGYYAVNEEGLYFRTTFESSCITAGNKEFAIQLSNSLGLTAEFEEAPDD